MQAAVSYVSWRLLVVCTCIRIMPMMERRKRSAAIWVDSSLPALGRRFRSGDAFSSRSLCHDAAAAAFATAQTFDELRHGRPRLDPEANEITLGDDAAMPTAQAAHRDHPPWTLPFPIRSRGHSITPTHNSFRRGWTGSGH